MNLVETVLAIELGVELISIDPLPLGGPIQRERIGNRDFEFLCPRVEWVRDGQRRAVFVPVATKTVLVGQWPFERMTIRQNDRATMDNFKRIFHEQEQDVRQLPYDYSRCADSKCPLARFCLRYLSPGRPGWQVYTEFPGGEGCYGFIDANKS